MAVDLLPEFLARHSVVGHDDSDTRRILLPHPAHQAFGSLVPLARSAAGSEFRQEPSSEEQVLELVDWLVQSHCTIAVMESTGSYWKPVSNRLEGALETWVVKAQHVKAVPGRKTDVKDAEWLAE